jgi:hypothetical protein
MKALERTRVAGTNDAIRGILNLAKQSKNNKFPCETLESLLNLRDSGETEEGADAEDTSVPKFSTEALYKRSLEERRKHGKQSLYCMVGTLSDADPEIQTYNNMSTAKNAIGRRAGYLVSWRMWFGPTGARKGFCFMSTDIPDARIHSRDVHLDGHMRNSYVIRATHYSDWNMFRRETPANLLLPTCDPAVIEEQLTKDKISPAFERPEFFDKGKSPLTDLLPPACEFISLMTVAVGTPMAAVGTPTAAVGTPTAVFQCAPCESDDGPAEGTYKYKCPFRDCNREFVSFIHMFHHVTRKKGDSCPHREKGEADCPFCDLPFPGDRDTPTHNRWERHLKRSCGDAKESREMKALLLAFPPKRRKAHMGSAPGRRWVCKEKDGGCGRAYTTRGHLVLHRRDSTTCRTSAAYRGENWWEEEDDNDAAAAAAATTQAEPLVIDLADSDTEPGSPPPPGAAAAATTTRLAAAAATTQAEPLVIDLADGDTEGESVVTPPVAASLLTAGTKRPAVTPGSSSTKTPRTAPPDFTRFNAHQEVHDEEEEPDWWTGLSVEISSGNRRHTHN